jgi:hypothetical protein
VIQTEHDDGPSPGRRRCRPAVAGNGDTLSRYETSICRRLVRANSITADAVDEEETPSVYTLNVVETLRYPSKSLLPLFSLPSS